MEGEAQGMRPTEFEFLWIFLLGRLKGVDGSHGSHRKQMASDGIHGLRMLAGLMKGLLTKV